jgi:hypothetical protein
MNNIFRVMCVLFLISGTAHAQQKRTTANTVQHQRLSPSPTIQLLSSVQKLEQELTVEKKEGVERWKYRDAYLYWLRQRAYPNDTINWNAYVRAFAQRLVMPKLFFRSKPTAGVAPPEKLIWEFVGPVRLPVPYRQFYGQGWTSGRVSGVTFANDKTIYLASAGGGVWKTTDKGQTWKVLSDSWENTKTSSVAVDPMSSDTVYIYTGSQAGVLWM